MTTTGLYAFNPAAANLTLLAFGRIGIRRTEITTQHMTDADVELNLLQVEISNKQPNLWRGQTYYRTLEEGTAQYLMPAQIIAISTAYLTTTPDGGSPVDRVLWPLSTFEYSAQPDKTQIGPPMSYWYDRQAQPQITFWPVPDGAATYTINMRVFSQIQDVNLVSGTTLELPYRFLDVFVAGLAHRLSRIYARDQEQMRKADYLDAWANAVLEDTEAVPLYIQPSFAGYYR